MQMDRNKKDIIEYASAVMCICSAISMGLTSMVISDKNDVASGVLILIAQLLLFAASVYQINYKLGKYGEANKRDSQ